MAGWQTLSSEVVYESPWIRVHRDETLDHKGVPHTYSYMELQNPSVFIVAVNDKNEVLLEKVYRYTLKRRIWEVPTGYMEPNEEPLAAAKRELYEETGLTSDNWKPLGRVYQIVGTGNVPLEAFLATNVQQTGDFTDKAEDITDRTFFSQEALKDMAAKGELIDTPVLALLYLASIHQKEMK